MESLIFSLDQPLPLNRPLITPIPQPSSSIEVAPSVISANAVVAKKRRATAGLAGPTFIDVPEPRLDGPRYGQTKRNRPNPVRDLIEQLRGARFDAENGKFKRGLKIVKDLLLSQSYVRSSNRRAEYKSELENVIDFKSLLPFIDEVIAEFEEDANDSDEDAMNDD